MVTRGTDQYSWSDQGTDHYVLSHQGTAHYAMSHQGMISIHDHTKVLTIMHYHTDVLLMRCTEGVDHESSQCPKLFISVLSCLLLVIIVKLLSVPNFYHISVSLAVPFPTRHLHQHGRLQVCPGAG